MKTSDSIEHLATALTVFQGIISTVHKDADNPYFKSKYASFGAVRKATAPELAKCGLSVVQGMPVNLDGREIGVTTRLIHKSGQWVETFTASAPAKDMSAQNVGAASSYLKRLAYCSILGVVADDDDDGEATRTAPAVNDPVYDSTNPQDEVILASKLKGRCDESLWVEIHEAMHGKRWSQLKDVATGVIEKARRK